MKARITNQYLSYIILLFSSIWVFFCFNESSMALESIALFAMLLLLNPRLDSFKDILLFLILTIFFTIALLMSGRLMERGGYNIPWKFLVKFFHILYAAMCGFVMRNLSKRQRKRVVCFALGSITISSIISLYYVLCVNSLAIRYRELVGISQTFTFDQLFALPLLAPVLILFYLRMKNILKHKVLFIAAVLAVFLCVFFSVLTTAILISLVGLALVFLFTSFEKGNKMAIFWAVLLVVFGGILLFFRTQVGEFLYGIIGNMPTVVKQRLSRVIDMLFATDHANTYSMDRRFELAGYSLDTFMSHPAFGIGIGGIQYGVIGYHQEWPDVLGVCGIVGAVILFLAFYIYFKKLFKTAANKVDKMGMVIGLILLLILGCLDPCLVLPELYVVMVILPNLSALVDDYKERAVFR